MRDPDIFKFDVRVRDRMMKAGRLTEDDLNRQLGSLQDVEENAAPLELDQPALGRSDGSAASRPSVPPPAISTADRDTEGVQGVQGVQGSMS